MKIVHKWLGKFGVPNWIGYDDAGRPIHHRNIRQLAHNDLIEEAMRLAAENAVLKEALEDISMERQNFTDRFSRQGLDDAHKLFDLADTALASPTETAKEGA